VLLYAITGKEPDSMKMNLLYFGIGFLVIVIGMWKFLKLSYRRVTENLRGVLLALVWAYVLSMVLSLIYGAVTKLLGTPPSPNQDMVEDIAVGNMNQMFAMAVLMVQFLNGTHLIQSKSGVSQLCRQYLLSMETRGYLDSGEEAMLLEELRQLGVENADLSGTTRSPVPFGSVITLQIRGTLGGNNEFTEVRASTAKY
jgi:hypothetical protein